MNKHNGIAISTSLGAMCIILLLINVPRLPPRPQTYREAVIRLLDARGISYREVEVENLCLQLLGPGRCEEHLFHSSIATMNVRIATERPPSAIGQITCRYYHADCSLFAPHLGLVNAPLRDLISVRSRPTRSGYIVEKLKVLWRVWRQWPG